MTMATYRREPMGNFGIVFRLGNIAVCHRAMPSASPAFDKRQLLLHLGMEGHRDSEDIAGNSINTDQVLFLQLQ